MSHLLLKFLWLPKGLVVGKATVDPSPRSRKSHRTRPLNTNSLDPGQSADRGIDQKAIAGLRLDATSKVMGKAMKVHGYESSYAVL